VPSIYGPSADEGSM